MLTFLPLYLCIGLIPAISLVCAWRSNRREVSSHKQQKKAPKLPASSTVVRRRLRCRPRWIARASEQARSTDTPKRMISICFVGENSNESENIEMQSLLYSPDSGSNKNKTALSLVAAHTEMVRPVRPPPTKTRLRKTDHLDPAYM